MKLPVEGFNEKQTDVMSQVKLVPLMMMVMVMMSVINAESVFVLLLLFIMAMDFHYTGS